MNESERKNETLSKKQLDALLALLSCPSIEEASKRAGISKVSIYEWLKQPEFAEELKRQRTKIFDQSVNFLIAATGKAVSKLVGLLETKKEGLRRLVCRDLIELSLRAREIEIHERLDAIEQRISEYERK